MIIKISNLGALVQAEFELGELTIICGGNNTGKTYATYALYGFLSYWHEVFSIKIEDEKILQLLQEGSTELNIQRYLEKANEFLKDACQEYTKRLPWVFASNEKYFRDTDFNIDLNVDTITPKSSFKRTWGTARTQLFSIDKQPGASKVTISLLVEKEEVKIHEESINKIIGDALKDIIFHAIFPKPFIASAERTGAAIFRKELYFARNRLLEQMSTKEPNVDPLLLLDKVYSDYALPVKDNVDFTRQLEAKSKKDSFIAKQHSEILDDFANLIGGRYYVTKNDELYYIPKSKNIKLTMDESSSAVRSLLDIGFYLSHVAQRGDLLMVDEPELNLHPSNQRRVARLFARLVNIGVKIFITTHSDYIIKELNTLIMLNQDKQYLHQIAAREGYKKEELLNANQIRVYTARDSLALLPGKSRQTRINTLVSADIDPIFGIEAKTFDDTIDEMNRIQEEIVWGGEK